MRPAPANASDEDRRSWLVVLDGGGLCTHEADCTARAKTELGTSTVWPKTFSVDTFAYMSTDTRNPFRDWNMVCYHCATRLHHQQGHMAEQSSSQFHAICL